MTQNSNKRFSNGLFSAGGLVIIVSILALSSSISAQLSGRPDRGFQAGNSYAISDIEAINMNSGNVSMSIPLASLPKGRGTSPGFTISLTYNSKIWDSGQKWESDGTQPTSSNPISYDYTRNLLRPAEDGGWQVFIDYKMKVIYRNLITDENGLETEEFERCVPNNTNYSKNGYAYKLEMQMPGGGVTVFRPYGSGADFVDYHKDGFYKIDINGLAHHYSLTTHVNDPDLGGRATCQYTTYQITTSGMNYYSTDGSNIRLFVPYVSGAYSTSGDRRWTMYYPNGTVIENKPADDSSIRQRITDVNNNRVKIKSDSHNGVAGTKILDDAGRFIFYGGGKVIQSSANGQELETTLTWKDVWVYREYQTITVNDFITPIPANKRNTFVSKQFSMIDEIILPTQAGGLTYKFTYHGDDANPQTGIQPYNETNGWGELASVKLPSGAKAEYKYLVPEFAGPTSFLEIISNSIVQKDLIYDETYDNQTTPRKDTWLYEISTGVGRITSPDGGVTTQLFYAKSPYSKDTSPDWRAGLVYKVTNPDGTVIDRTWKQAGTQTTGSGQALNAYVESETTTIKDVTGIASLKTKRDYKYDQNLNLLEVQEYDWIAAGASNYVLNRKMVNSYYNQGLAMESTTTNSNFYGNPASPTFLNLAKSSEVQNGSNLVASRTENKYDGGLLNPTKGNLTETKVWDSVKQPTLGSPDGNGFKLTPSNSINSTTAYDTYGNPTLITDAKGVQTQITYGAINGNAGLYPTETKTAYGLPEQRSATVTYDFNTGLTLSATDVDNNVTSATEYDSLGRPLKVKSAVGTANEIWSQTEYDDTLRRVITRTDLTTKGDGKKVSIRHFDELGRVRLSRMLEDSSTEDAYNEQDGIKVQARYRYDNGGDPANSNGSYSLTSNPYRAATSTAATNEETMGWSVGYSNKTGKYSTSESFGGATLPAPWGSNNATNGKMITQVDSNATTATDATGRQKRSITNALGQLVRIDEPDNSGNLGSVGSPVQATSYKYNTLGNMIEVTQGVQKRHFMYDSLGRMLRVYQPEQEVNTGLNKTHPETTNSQWTAGFTFDDNGNVLTSTDAKNNTINYSYDNINRIKTQTYTDGITPNVTYTYDDGSVPFSKGRLTKVSSSVSTTQTTQFDIMGRPKVNQQITDGTTYQMKYVYNLSGQLVEEEYPSGRKVKNDLDANGDIARIYGNATATATEKTYANGFAYTVDGKIQKLKLGNGRWESAKFNSNLQATEIALGTSDGNGSLWKINYEYGELNATNGTVDTSKNTGNVAKQTIDFNGMAKPFVQTYKYDSLYRITEAKEMNDTTQTWKQTYGYDKYGNRTAFSQNVHGQNLAINNVTLPSVDANKNRFNTGQGYTYDKIGNLTKDVTKLNGVTESRDITFNGDNKQIEIKDTNTGKKIGEYSYDGSGKRVKKRLFDGNNQPLEDVIFVYSGDKLVAEYSTTPKTNPKIQYVATDTLGSVRAITDQYGQVVSRRDFMPFGEELQADATYRKANLKYNPDDVRQKFTGYQKDEETGLDFAEARMYNNSHARFTAVDPLLASGKSANPQSFNRYAYVMNSPTKYTDPTGLQVGMNNERCTAEQQCSGTITRGTTSEYRLNFNTVPIATVNVSSGETPTLIETSSSNVSANIASQPAYNLPELPYTSPAGLIYDPGSVDEIDRHINGRADKSQYYAGPLTTLFGNEFYRVIERNDYTILNGTSHQQFNGNTIYISAARPIGFSPFFTTVDIVGFDQYEQDYTNVNTLIVYPNGIVTTSHPGLPFQYDGPNLPANIIYLRDIERELGPDVVTIPSIR